MKYETTQDHMWKRVVCASTSLNKFHFLHSTAQDDQASAEVDTKLHILASLTDMHTIYTQHIAERIFQENPLIYLFSSFWSRHIQ